MNEEDELKVREIVAAVHYYNNLWHISMEIEGIGSLAKEMFLRQKNHFQKKLFINHKEQCVFTPELEKKSESEPDTYRFEIMDLKDLDACHVPVSLVEKWRTEND
jgi:hypothetical protein